MLELSFLMLHDILELSFLAAPYYIGVVLCRYHVLELSFLGATHCIGVVLLGHCTVHTILELSLCCTLGCSCLFSVLHTVLEVAS